MTPLDHLRSSFVRLDEDVQYVIRFALVPALADDLRAKRTRSERDFIKALEAWLAPSRFTPPAIGEAVSATASTDCDSGEVLSVDAPVRRTGSQPGQGKRLDQLEKAVIRTVAQASALIEQSRREVERSRILLKSERGQAGDAQACV